MSMLGSLVVRIGVNIDEFAAGMKRIEDQIKNVEKRFEGMTSVGERISDVGKKITGVGLALGGALGFAAKAGLEYNAQIQQTQIALAQMLGSQAKAESMIKKLADFAAKTPFQFPELADATRRMLAFGFSAEQIMPMLKAVGDAAAGLGLSGSEGINRIITALGQMRAKGKVSAEEMLQLTEAGVPAWEILAQAMGKSTAEVQKLAEKGLIPADKAIQALVDGMEKRFPNMMDKQSKSFSGLMSTLRDEIDRTLGKAFKPLFDWLTEEGLPMAIKFVQQFGSSLVYIAAGAAAFALIIGPLLMLVGFIPQVVAGFGVLTGIFAGIGTVLGTVLPLLLGIAAAAGLIYAAFTTNFAGIRDIVLEVWEFIKAVFSEAISIIIPQVEGFINYVVAQWPKVKATLQAFFDWLEPIFSVVFNNVANIVKTAFNAIMLVVTDVVNIVIGIVKFFVAVLSGDWRTAWETVKSVLRSAVSVIKTIISGVFGIGGSILRIVIDGLSALVKQVIAIGEQIAKGLWDGISRMTGWLRDKIVSWAKRVLPGPIADLLGIRSPSKLMAEYGRYVALGLAKGMENATRYVSTAAAGLAKAVPVTLERDISVTFSGQMSGEVPEKQVRERPIYLLLDGKVVGQLIAPHIETELNRREALSLRMVGVET